jgi:hypothetical protein
MHTLYLGNQATDELGTLRLTPIGSAAHTQ